MFTMHSSDEIINGSNSGSLVTGVTALTAAAVCCH
jgi:hypothetical protein